MLLDAMSSYKISQEVLEKTGIITITEEFIRPIVLNIIIVSVSFEKRRSIEEDSLMMRSEKYPRRLKLLRVVQIFKRLTELIYHAH